MTPKEKAKELVNRFAKLPEEGSLMWYLSFEIAKKCALIAVDLLLYYSESPEAYIEFEEIKQEIELL